jgi:pimeloyl-ACP methyl ester carboxylesterase
MRTLPEVLMLPVQHLVVAGVRTVVYDSAPQAGGEAVVFVHGNPGPSDDWEQLAPAIAPFARTIAMDLPGYGRAEHPYNFDFTVEGYAGYLALLLEQLGVTRAHLVLHDFGGPFGLAWAAAHPEKFASVTLINTGLLVGFSWHKYARIWQTPLLGELFQASATLPLFKAALKRDNPKPLPDSFAERIMSYADWPHKRAVLKLYRASRDLGAQLARYLPLAKDIDRPACVIWGAEDPFVPVRFADQQREVFPRAEVHKLPGLGHWPFIDDPAAVLAALVPFLRAQVGADAKSQSAPLDSPH